MGEKIISQLNQKQINLSDFPKGIYFAKINGEKVVKLIKEYIIQKHFYCLFKKQLLQSKVIHCARL